MTRPKPSTLTTMGEIDEDVLASVLAQELTHERFMRLDDAALAHVLAVKYRELWKERMK